MGKGLIAPIIVIGVVLGLGLGIFLFPYLFPPPEAQETLAREETGALVAPEGVAQGGVGVEGLHAGADDVRGGGGRGDWRD